MAPRPWRATALEIFSSVFRCSSMPTSPSKISPGPAGALRCPGITSSIQDALGSSPTSPHRIESVSRSARAGSTVR